MLNYKIYFVPLQSIQNNGLVAQLDRATAF